MLPLPTSTRAGELAAAAAGPGRRFRLSLGSDGCRSCHPAPPTQPCGTGGFTDWHSESLNFKVHSSLALAAVGPRGEPGVTWTALVQIIETSTHSDAAQATQAVELKFTAQHDSSGPCINQPADGQAWM